MKNEILSIKEVLGSNKTLHHKLDNMRDLEEITKQGLPKGALKHLVAEFLNTEKGINEIIYKIIPESTYKRAKKLSPEMSERVIRIARLIVLSEFILGANAYDFLNKKHKLLDDRKPYEAAISEIGGKRVEDLLWKIFYGIAV